MEGTELASKRIPSKSYPARGFVPGEGGSSNLSPIFLGMGLLFYQEFVQKGLYGTVECLSYFAEVRWDLAILR
jgi:hypothetical protein